jgi:transglutaminase superfamily protein/uncharacterized protein DUF4129
MSLARQWVGKATTPRAQSVGLLTGLTTAVTYDGAATPPDGADVVTWTLQHKRANAVALTTTFIVLGRALGLPLRMAEGYLPGTFDTKLKQMVVRGSDTAVWAQLAVPGAGWFDLFPAAHEVTVSVPSKIIYKGAPTPTLVPATPTPTSTRPGTSAGNSSPPPSQTPFGGSSWLLPVLAAFIALLLVTGALSFIRWKWARFGAQLAPLGQFFARVGLLARLGGIALRPSDTSLQATGKVAAVVPAHRDVLTSLNGTYERVRYGPPHAHGVLPNLQAQWRRVRGALWRLVFTRPWRRHAQR